MLTERGVTPAVQPGHPVELGDQGQVSWSEVASQNGRERLFRSSRQLLTLRYEVFTDSDLKDTST